MPARLPDRRAAHIAASGASVPREIRSASLDASSASRHGFGGPIIKDKAFALGALTISRRTTDLMSLLSADSVTLQRLGTDPALADRFLAAMNGYGIPATRLGIPRDALVDHASALVRADYRLNDSHTLMARGDVRWSAQEATRIAPLAVPNNGGEGDNIDGGGMLTLTSQLGSFINELRAYQSVERRDAAPYITIPDGRVITRDTVDWAGTRPERGERPVRIKMHGPPPY